MKPRLRRIALAGLALGAGGLLVLASGIMPVSASGGHWRITRWLLEFGMERSIATHSLGIQAPDLSDPALVLQGAAHYEIGCRSCHGAPRGPIPQIATRMLPPPPELSARVEQSTPEKLFYIVKHGLKFTGMPAWPSERRDDEVWAMVAFLRKLPELDGEGYRRLIEGEVPAGAARGKSNDDVPPPPAIAQACARCHGVDGRGREGVFPRLAGQRREYLENALAAYAAGRRHSGTMGPVASALAPEARHEAANYYAERRAGPSSGSSGDAGAIARGRIIALEGIPSQRVPACVECHGPGAKRGKPAYPSLAGQSAKYLEHQLGLISEQRRGGSAYAHLMRPVAGRLTTEQRRDAAAYFASLPPDAGRER